MSMLFFLSLTLVQMNSKSYRSPNDSKQFRKLVKSATKSALHHIPSANITPLHDTFTIQKSNSTSAPILDSPDTIFFTDSICKKATSNAQQFKIHHIPLSGKKICYLKSIIKSYSLPSYTNIILHIGTVDVLELFQQNLQRNVKIIINRYRALLHEIKKLNSNINISISALIPMPRYFEYGSESFINNINKELTLLAADTSRTVIMKTYKLFRKSGEVIITKYRDEVHPNDEEAVNLVKFFGQARDINIFMQMRHKLTHEHSLMY